ncbi:hypothetical protein BJ165DRAFT_1400371 [Panaeolus papilionaceus]|nr:hypothetical protein BJ165DRAFT_1400371 [Panaeolus papilionaceus]
MPRRLSRKHPIRRGESGSGTALASDHLSSQSSATIAAPQVSETLNIGSNIIANGRATSPITIAFAVIASVCCIALFIVLGTWAYRRGKQKERQKRASNFNQAIFSEKKDPFAFLPNQPIRVDLPTDARFSTLPLHERSRSRPNIVSHIETEDAVSGDKTPNTASTFRVTNGIGSPPAPTTTFPTIPSPVVDKQRSSRAKPKSLDISKLMPEEIAFSPPPSYNMANGFTPGQELFIPIPAMLPPEKAKAVVMPPTPPVTTSKFSIKPRRSSKDTVEGDMISVASPARSESFAAKDLEIPVSAAIISPSTNGVDALPIALPTPNASFRPSSAGSPRLPRMMAVIATYVPNLPDELEVQVGDTVRVLQQYKDGWCFAQQIGKMDAPRGVVPLICLQERQRMVPLSKKLSDGSMESFRQWK